MKKDIPQPILMISSRRVGTAGVLGGYCFNTAWLLKIDHGSEIDYGTLAISVAAIAAGIHLGRQTSSAG